MAAEKAEIDRIDYGFAMKLIETAAVVVFIIICDCKSQFLYMRSMDSFIHVPSKRQGGFIVI